VAESEVALVDQVAVPHHEQAAIPGAALDEIECGVELRGDDSRRSPDVACILKLAPTPGCVGRGKVAVRRKAGGRRFSGGRRRFGRDDRRGAARKTGSAQQQLRQRPAPPCQSGTSAHGKIILRQRRPQGNAGMERRKGVTYDVGMRSVGRLLQMLGLLLLPLAVVLELTKEFGLPFGLKDMLVMLVFSAAVFYIGRLVEGYARR
jgi:hypothetical protein